MPIYEFYCSECHRLYSFLSRAVSPDKRPACPRCGRPELSRRVSSFAISKGRQEEPSEDPFAGMDESRLEKAMESLAGEAENLNEDDPRQASQMMRKLFDATGLPLGAGMEEALRRMEAGEDMEKIEQDLGDVLEEDPFGAGMKEARKTGRLRHALPPTVDPKLYEM
jgi:putative FmdB family regulatory protein